MHNANAHPTHRHRPSSNAVATEHNRSPWLDPLFYGEGVADEKSRQQKAAAAAAARSRHSHTSSISSNPGNSAAFTPEAAEAVEAGTAQNFSSRKSSRDYSKWEAARGRRGLVSFAKNGWAKIKEPAPGDMGYTPHGVYYGGSGGGGRGFFTSCIRSPRRLFRPRTLLWLTVLFVLWFTYTKMIGTFRYYQEEHLILKSLDWRNRERVGGWFGSNKIPEFPDLVYMKELDHSLLPAPRAAPLEKRSSKRLVIVGDCKNFSTTLNFPRRTMTT
ncbi:hypothetical protein AAP_02783 [Ascosphaera apis ARSEF 7405]|uniref:Uncharacterized protein n=1 Tax=Ascosphaera apis ARSEF 7405 TaxID=392613 RepID=A0A167ZID7_9EURO|nr:hypothetical protein AAP_02783 [Ascosphaera apis ARSEF 7405]